MTLCPVVTVSRLNSFGHSSIPTRDRDGRETRPESLLSVRRDVGRSPSPKGRLVGPSPPVTIPRAGEPKTSVLGTHPSPNIIVDWTHPFLPPKVNPEGKPTTLPPGHNVPPSDRPVGVST